MNLNQNIIKKTYIFFISFLFIFFSCNSDDDHSVAVAGVNLDKEELSLEVGAESTLIATVTPTTATNKEVTWSSDKPNIVAVANGLVTAVAIGTATITVTASVDNTKTDAVTVRVTSTLTEFSIADVNVTRGTTSFDIFLTLIPTEATVDYSLIDPPTGVTMAGTTINIAVDMAIGEYNITVKATGKDNYIGETETTFRLIIRLNNNFVIDFRDVNFKNAVKSNLNITANEEVTYRDVKNVTLLDVARERITNMEEIIYFTSLRELNCSRNQLTSLDLSQNTDLEILTCYSNQLTSLDLSQNTHLKYLSCSSNQLTSLNIRQNTVLEILYCYDNRLTNLDLSQNTDLEGLFCYNNPLTSLDISQNTDLEMLTCYSNQLTSLDLSQNTVLKEFYCYNNPLTSLDIRGMRSVLWLSFSNTLQTLKVHQNIKDVQDIITLKTAIGDDLTISTYSAPTGSTNYTLICNDYVPRVGAGGGSCGD